MENNNRIMCDDASKANGKKKKKRHLLCSTAVDSERRNFDIGFCYNMICGFFLCLCANNQNSRDGFWWLISTICRIEKWRFGEVAFTTIPEENRVNRRENRNINAITGFFFLLVYEFFCFALCGLRFSLLYHQRFESNHE